MKKYSEVMTDIMNRLATPDMTFLGVFCQKKGWEYYPQGWMMSKSFQMIIPSRVGINFRYVRGMKGMDDHTVDRYERTDRTRGHSRSYKMLYHEYGPISESGIHEGIPDSELEFLDAVSQELVTEWQKHQGAAI